LPIYQYLSYSTLNPTILPPSDPNKKLPSTHTTKKKKKKEEEEERREKREERRVPYPILILRAPPFYPSNLKLIISSSHDILHTYTTS